MLFLVVTLAGCSNSVVEPTSEVSATAPSSTSSSDEATSLQYVAFGDSWPEGAHCNGCVAFPKLWAQALEEETGREVEMVDYTGEAEASTAQSKGSGSLLASLRSDAETRAAVEGADVILISTGTNDGEETYGLLQAGSCGGSDDLDCVRELGELWHSNFDAILGEIEAIRGGEPVVIRLVNAANGFLSIPEMSEGLPDGFSTGGGALMFELLTTAMCDAAEKHGSVCVDIRPVLNGPAMDEPVDENSQESMQAVADAIAAAGLPELNS